jgi:hypothetical protein
MNKPTSATIDEAKKNPNGWVYQIDFDYLPNDYTPPEAIEGAWQVDANGVITGVFEPNKNYRPIEESNRVLPLYMQRSQMSEVGMWILEMDLRCEHLFPQIPKEATVGYWLVGIDGKITNKFRPSSKYDPDKIPELLKAERKA